MSVNGPKAGDRAGGRICLRHDVTRPTPNGNGQRRPRPTQLTPRASPRCAMRHTVRPCRRHARCPSRCATAVVPATRPRGAGERHARESPHGLQASALPLRSAQPYRPAVSVTPNAFARARGKRARRRNRRPRCSHGRRRATARGPWGRAHAAPIGPNTVHAAHGHAHRFISSISISRTDSTVGDCARDSRA